MPVQSTTYILRGQILYELVHRKLYFIHKLGSIVRVRRATAVSVTETKTGPAFSRYDIIILKYIGNSKSKN